MAIDPRKYFVCKRSQIEPLLQHVLGRKFEAFMEEVDLADDSVVIRLQDIFAGPALATYANSIRLAKQFVPAGALRDHLHEIQHYFLEMELRTRAYDGKVPD